MRDPTLTVEVETTEEAHAFLEWFFDHVECDAVGVDMQGGSTGTKVRIEFSGLDL